MNALELWKRDVEDRLRHVEHDLRGVQGSSREDASAIKAIQATVQKILNKVEDGPETGENRHLQMIHFLIAAGAIVVGFYIRGLIPR